MVSPINNFKYIEIQTTVDWNHSITNPLQLTVVMLKKEPTFSSNICNLAETQTASSACVAFEVD